MISLHITGYIALVYHAFLVSWFGTTVIFLIGLAHGVTPQAGPILLHIFCSFLFLTLFPGQRFWTIRVSDRHEQDRTVVGAISEIEEYFADPSEHR